MTASNALSDRDELVELMSRYANIADTKNWDELPRSVFCDEFTADYSAFGTPAATVVREAWAARSRQAFAGWTATHHAITNYLIAVDHDRATIRAHVHVEHWAPPAVAPAGSNCWLVVGFYDNAAVRTADGWRLSSVKLSVTYQENGFLLAASMAAAAEAGSAEASRLDPRTEELTIGDQVKFRAASDPARPRRI